nr:hypothetical protein [Acutalibacter muris]
MAKYLSADELYRYLHISKRKLKYLLENDYIPCIDTGKKTHRFLIRASDAKEFKRRMDTEPGFLSELYGQFNSGVYTPRKKLIESTPENCAAFREFLIGKWADYPDALPTKLAAELIGCAPQRVGDWMRKGVISGVSIGGVRYCSKGEFIAYCASPNMLKKPGAGRYRELIAEFISLIES